MGDNGRFYLKLQLHLEQSSCCGTMDGVQWTCYGEPWTCPWCPIIGINVHGAPFSENIYFLNSLSLIWRFLQLNIIFYFTIKNVLIDTGSPSNMPVDMSIVPHPHVHGASSSGHHGHLLTFFSLIFKEHPALMHVLYCSQTFWKSLHNGRWYVNVLHKYLKLIQNEN